jgi:hypothetical protein
MFNVTVTSIPMQVLQWQPWLAILICNPFIRGHYFLYAEPIFYSSITIIFAGVYDMFTPFNIFMQMHFLASSHTYMHYINALHRGNLTKTCPWSGIGAITLKSFKKLYPVKTCLQQSIGTFALSKRSKTSPLVYYIKWLTIFCSK